MKYAVMVIVDGKEHLYQICQSREEAEEVVKVAQDVDDIDGTWHDYTIRGL